MTGEELKSQAIIWFGRRGWQTGLANTLGIDRTTVWRMVTNDMVPGPVAAAVDCWRRHGLPKESE